MGPFQIVTKIPWDIRNFVFNDGVNDTGDKMVTGVNDTGDETLATKSACLHLNTNI